MNNFDAKAIIEERLKKEKLQYMNDFIESELMNLSPPYELMDSEPFCKYGYLDAGLHAGWYWNNNLCDATTEEKLYMIALANTAWLKKYEKYHDDDIKVFKHLGYNESDIYKMKEDLKNKSIES